MTRAGAHFPQRVLDMLGLADGLPARPTSALSPGQSLRQTWSLIQVLPGLGLGVKGRPLSQESVLHPNGSPSPQQGLKAAPGFRVGLRAGDRLHLWRLNTEAPMQQCLGLGLTF